MLQNNANLKKANFDLSKNKFNILKPKLSLRDIN